MRKAGIAFADSRELETREGDNFFSLASSHAIVLMTRLSCTTKTVLAKKTIGNRILLSFIEMTVPKHH